MLACDILRFKHYVKICASFFHLLLTDSDECVMMPMLSKLTMFLEGERE